MYEIVGVYRGKAEVIDTAESRTEAEYLTTEYRIAYGIGWTIYFRKQKGV